MPDLRMILKPSLNLDTDIGGGVVIIVIIVCIGQKGLAMRAAEVDAVPLQSGEYYICGIL